MVESVRPGVRGFTLVEALIATLLSSVVVMLVSSVFLVQNQFYSDTVNRSALHENVRGATYLVSSELSGVSTGGVLTAEKDAVVFRAPFVLGGVCGAKTGETYVFLPLGGEDVDESIVKGYALRSAGSGWRYTPASWVSIRHSSGNSAARVCALEGADTTGAQGDFFRLDGLASSPPIEVGDLVMLYREVELRLAPSTLVPGSRAIYKGPAGSHLTEFATGLSAESGFEYGVSNKSGFQDQVNGKGNLDRLVRIRFLLEGTAPPARPGRPPLSFDLTRTVYLRDVD